MEVTQYSGGAALCRTDREVCGVVVSTSEEVVWAEPMPTIASAQRAELVALIKTLELGQEWKINVDASSCYAFATACVHRASVKKGDS